MPGIAVAMIGAGSLLVYSGIRNVPIVDALRSIVRGQAPSTASTAAVAGFTPTSLASPSSPAASKPVPARTPNPWRGV